VSFFFDVLLTVHLSTVLAINQLNALILFFILSYLYSSTCFEHWLRAGRSGIESRWGRDFLSVQTGPGDHPTSCKMGTGSFPGVKCGRGVLLTTHPLLVPRSRKSRAITLPTLLGHTGSVTGSLYLYMFRALLCPSSGDKIVLYIIWYRHPL